MNLTELLKEYDFFKKKISKSGNQLVVSIPSDAKDNFKAGEEVLVLKEKKKK